MSTYNKNLVLYKFGLKILYACYNYTLIIIALMYLVCELIAFRKALGELTSLVSQAGMLMTHLVGLGKFYILVLKREQIEDVKALLQDKRYQYRALDDFQPAQRLRKERRLSAVMSIFMFFLYTFVGVSGHISAAITVKKNTVGEAFVGNATCQTFTPYQYYYPFDVSTPTGCHYSLIYMDISLDIYAFYIATLDMIFVGLLHLLRTQLNILGEALTTLRKRCLRKLRMNTNLNVLHDSDCPELEQEMFNELTRCTKHLYTLLHVRNEIEDIFNFITLVQTLASLMIFASCLFVSARVPLSSPNFFSSLEYFLAVLTQFSIYCWFGNQMTIAGEAIPGAIYNGDWLSSSLRYKRSMLLTMARMKRPLFVSIGKFSPLALPTLLAVIKGSFSYFTVFQSVGTVEELE